MNPYQVVWEMSLRCNMHCIHCGSAAGKTRPTELTTSQAKKVIHQLDAINTETLVFIGGEPFLRKDWFELAKEVNKTNIQLLILSNGYNISDDIIDKLSRLRSSGYGVSIDGGTSATHDYIRQRKGSFDQCFSYLDRLKEKGLPAMVVTTIFKDNIKELPKLRSLLKGKVYAWQIQMAEPTGRFSKDNMLSLSQFYSLGKFIHTSQLMPSLDFRIAGADCCGYFSKKFSNECWEGCQAGKRVLGLRSNGDILSCLSINRDEYVEGNVLKDDITKLWNSPTFASFNKKFELGSNCIGCPHGEICGGGCSSQSINLYGEPHNDGYCYHLYESNKKL
jgi:radical SAM protein with 4Fe4S-binding SPASM domain